MLLHLAENILGGLGGKAPSEATGKARRNQEISADGLRQRLVQIGDDVVDILDSDRHPDHVRQRARGFALFVRQLPVRGRCRVDDQRPRRRPGSPRG